ncbi:hypothetical protein O181_092907, partial [Austropuccinia psidii MF-1]|nr:hypothetical protein [Austropuccinia psidii MF-1]
VPNDGKFPPKCLVREFQNEQEELKRKLEEKNKEEQQKKKEKLISSISIDNWGDWEPPCLSTGLDEPFRGAVHTVVGRPFLADNGTRLKHSQQQGKILSYKESDGRRLCIPICTPKSKGWNTGPPRGIEMCNVARITELKNEGPKSKSPPKKFQFDIEEKKNYSRKKTNESIYHVEEEKPQKIELLLVSSQRISKLDNNDPLLHPKFENTYSSNMESSTIEVEPVQKKGSKPKQLVKMVSNRYGKNAQWDFHCPGTQPAIKEEINPTKIENRITEPEVESTNQNLETNLSEEG